MVLPTFSILSLALVGPPTVGTQCFEPNAVKISSPSIELVVLFGLRLFPSFADFAARHSTRVLVPSIRHLPGTNLISSSLSITCDIVNSRNLCQTLLSLLALRNQVFVPLAGAEVKRTVVAHLRASWDPERLAPFGCVKRQRTPS